MRSLLDEEADASLDSLTLDHEMEQSLAAAADPQGADCAAEARQRLTSARGSVARHFAAQPYRRLRPNATRLMAT